MNEDKEKSTIRSILHHEITWTILLLGAGWQIVVQIILPIQRLQIGVANVQEQMAQLTGDHDAVVALSTEIAQMKDELTSMELEHKTIEAKLSTIK